MLRELFLGKTCSSSYDKEVIDTLRLIRSENVGPRTFWALIEVFGTASLAIDNIQDFSLRGGLTKPINVFSSDSASKELDLLEKINAHIKK